MPSNTRHFFLGSPACRIWLMSFGAMQPLEETVAHLIASCHIRESDGEIGFTVVDEVQFLTFNPCQCGIYSTFLQIAEQCRVVSFLTSNVGNSVRMPAGEKRKIQVGRVAFAPLSYQAGRVHSPNRKVPVPMR